MQETAVRILEKVRNKILNKLKEAVARDNDTGDDAKNNNLVSNGDDQK